MVDLELHAVTPALEHTIAAKDFGAPAIETGKFTVAIADKPIALAVAALSQRLGREIPAEVDLYQRFAVWLVPNRVSIIRRSGSAEVTSVGVECEYVNGEKTCSVVSLLPAPQFIVWGEAHGGFRCQGDLSFAGETLPVGGQLGAVNFREAGIGFGISSSAKLSAYFSLNVITPYVAAVGIGASRAEWRFDRHKEALFGRDVETWATIVLPKRQKALGMRMRVYLTLRTAFFSTRHESPWQSIECMLGG
ncbi:MAG TPA: hypothetical protein VEK57_25050 [Thermoanaerobaculia bacterium]|nr:hypothetical protein [Thermoanaerobaculia bacterium]